MPESVWEWGNVWACVCVYNVRMCILVYMHVCMGIHVYMGYVHVNGYMLVWVHVCSVTCCIILDSLVRFELGSGRIEFAFVVDPIHGWFKDRSIGWSVDLYRFMQWRPDGNSVPKLHHFMWVFVLVSSLLLLSVGIYVLLVSFHVTVCYILAVWSLVLLHETSLSVHLIYLGHLSDYQRHFMCWQFVAVALGLVLEYLRL